MRMSPESMIPKAMIRIPPRTSRVRAMLADALVRKTVRIPPMTEKIVASPKTNASEVRNAMRLVFLVWSCMLVPARKLR